MIYSEGLTLQKENGIPQEEYYHEKGCATWIIWLESMADELNKMFCEIELMNINLNFEND